VPVLAKFYQTVSALPEALTEQSPHAVALHRRLRLFNGKSHRTLVWWDFPLYIVVASNISTLHDSPAGEYAPECPISAKDFRFGESMSLRVIVSLLRH
jgi:hypothetical protein